MSSLIFPSLAGVKMNVRRTPVHATDVQTAVSGKELRTSWQSYPRYRYSVAFEFLRSAASYTEFQKLMNFLSRHSGAYDSFLFTDPEDASVIDHGFGVGNGVATAFQLQRTMGVSTVDVLGTWAQYTKPRTNYLVRSNGFANAAWFKTGAGTGSAPVVTGSYAEAPDGTITASLVKFRLGGGTTNSDASNLSQAFAVKVGNPYVHSMWLKTADGTTKVMQLKAGAGVPPGITVTGTWQRFSMNWIASTSATAILQLRGGDFQTSDTADLLVWGAQYEDGLTPTRYIQTAVSAITESPAYWPAAGDGFEPVFDSAPGLTLFLTDWQGKRVLLPYSRTNLFLRSEEFDNAAWTKASLTVTPNATGAPDGTTNAEKIVENVSTNEHKLYQAVTAADNTTLTISCWGKAAERTQLYLFFATKAGTFPGCMFDLVGGTVQQQNNGAVGTITAYPDGWYRCTCSASIASGGSSPFAQILVIGPANSTNYLGNGTSGIYVFGAQLETPPQGNAATPYIKTTTTAVTLTDYSISAGGLVTLAVAPVVGAALSWTGSYYRRVRMDSDSVDFERLFNLIWEAKGLDMISVKP